MKRPTDAENRQIGTKVIIDIYGQIFTLKTIFKKDKVSYSLFLILFSAVAHEQDSVFTVVASEPPSFTSSSTAIITSLTLTEAKPKYITNVLSVAEENLPQVVLELHHHILPHQRLEKRVEKLKNTTKR